MEQWQDAASRQAKLLTHRLNELLTSGLELLHSELGVDLGLQPELIPPWVLLLAACIGLVLMVALWASIFRGIFGKKRPAVNTVDDSVQVSPGVVKPAVKPEEQQKKKKKKADKKAQAAQPNGRAVAETAEDAIVSEETVPHQQPPPPDVQAEKVAETKKAKKKAKQAAKDSKTLTAAGKEPEEGTWETKVSIKEKREQRKKDKTPGDGSGSPGGGDTPIGTSSEPPKAAAAPTAAGQKKKKGESTKVKAEKVEAVVSQVESSEAAVVAGGLIEKVDKVPPRSVGPDPGHWPANQDPKPLWGTDIDGSWTVIERGMKTDLNLVSLAGLGVQTAESQPKTDLPWLRQPQVEDEWSGLTRGSVDPSSDWNAPSEVWGNYEEPTPEPLAPQEQPPPEPANVNLLTRADDEEEMDKVETAADGEAKTKKKKKKKKKAAEEGGAAGQEAEEPEKEAAPVKKQPPVQERAAAVQPVKAAAAAAVQPVKAAAVEVRVERPVKDNISQKPPVTVPQKPNDDEPTAKQNNLPAAAQQKNPDSQAPKPVKKKKARRET